MNKIIKLKDGKEFVFRDVALSDAFKIKEYYDKLFVETHNFTFDETNIPSIEKIESMLQTISTNKLHVMFVIEFDNKIIAHVDISPKSSKRKLKHRCELGIGVLMAHWGNGLANAMLKEIINRAKELNYEQMDLIVLRENTRARKLYERNGFIETGYIKNSFKFPDGSYEDGVMMYLDIKENNGI